MKKNFILLTLFFLLAIPKFSFGQMNVGLTSNKYNICSGEGITLTIVGEDLPSSYSYYLFDESGTDISGPFNSGTRNISNVTATQKYHIRVMDKSLDPDAFITPHSNEVTVTVFNPPSYTISAPSTVCLDAGNRVVYNFQVSPYRASATYSLHYMNGGTETAASGTFTNLGGGTFSYDITADIAGDDTDYFMKVTENGCTVNSAQTKVRYRKAPTTVNENRDPGTRIMLNTTDPPFVLNQLLKVAEIPSDTELEFDDHDPVNDDAVIENSDGTFSFDPSLVSLPGEYQVDYLLDNGCNSRYLLANTTFVVVDPSNNLPAFLKVAPPHSLICENLNSITLLASVHISCQPVFFVNPLLIDLIYRDGYVPAAGEVKVGDDISGNDIIRTQANWTAFDGSGNFIYEFNIDPSQHIPNQFFININVTNTECNLSGNIPLFPRRNPIMTGLPSPVTGTENVLVCSASHDTMFVRGNPMDGSYNFYHGTPDPGQPGEYIYSKFKHGIGTYGIEERSLLKFVPAVLFADSMASAADDVIKIVYTFPKDAKGACPDSVTRIIKFLPPVPITFTRPAKACFGETVPFEVTGHSAGDKFSWNFGDGFSLKFDTAAKVKRDYLAPGLYPVRFKTQVATLDPTIQCNNDIIDSLRVGAQPITDFDVYKNYIQQDTPTLFHSLAVIKDTSITDKDEIVSWEWKIDPPVNINHLSTTKGDTSILFTEPSQNPYRVIHIATARHGCTDTSEKYIPIFKINTLQLGEFKLDTFGLADVDNSWFESGEYLHLNKVSSWQNTFPNEHTIKGTPERGNAWITRKNPHPNVGYYNNEKSYVESPIYDIRELELPMIALDTWTNFDLSLDGASVQYTYCDSIPFGKEKWYTLGAKDKGLNWYNSNSIIGEPGGKFDGWTNVADTSWNLSAYRLDSLEVPLGDTSHNFIRFRVVIGTNSENFPERLFDGFAFDNFFIGERNRRVLVEEFCDYLHYENDLDNIFKDPQAIRIQYHLRTHTSNDSINIQNKAEPSARALLYGVGKNLPRGVIDGILVNNEKELGDWGPDEFLKRSLHVSPFEIDINPAISGGKLKVTSTIHKKNTEVLTGSFIVQIAIVEKEVTANGITFTNVLRNMIPNSAGHRIPVDYDWSVDPSITADWSPFAPIQSDLMVIVFIQNEDTKEIYQSNYVLVTKPSPVALPVVRSASLSGSGQVSFSEVSLSPNPTSADLTIRFNGILNTNYNYTIIDGIGNIITSGKLYGNSNAAILNTSNLSSGIYSIIFEGEGQKIVKKFAVIK